MRTALLLILIFTTTAYAQEAKMDSAFKPTCIEANIIPKEVQPGGQVSVTLKFQNTGTASASANYQVFLHLESQKSCDAIISQSDHFPSTSTTAWKPDRAITDGPCILNVPSNAKEGTYYVHAGVYASNRQRFCDQYVGEIIVSKNASAKNYKPPIMSTEEILRRRNALAGHVEYPLTIENDKLAFTISMRNGAWFIKDKATKETWYSNPEKACLGEVEFKKGNSSVVFLIDSLTAIGGSDSKCIRLQYIPDLEGDPPVLNFEFRLTQRGGVEFRYFAQETSWKVERVRLLDRGLWATDVEKGYLAIPHRLGIMFPAGEGLPSRNVYTAYSNYKSYSMAMFGVVKNDSAILVHWDDPYVILEAERTWPDIPTVPAHGMVSASLTLRKTANSFTVEVLGHGGYAEIAKAYRRVAKDRGLLRTWKEKITANSQVEAILGAADFKPFVLSRVMPKTRWNHTDKEVVNVQYTFDEAAQIAEHLKNDLGIDRAMFVLAGWIRRGYDNQHPDILPAAPECGGNEGLSECARRVRNLGFLFGLHDNYQDMYRDSPSWDESYLLRNPDGSVRKGGVWAGGQAYITCSKKAIELAKRDQNLPAVKKLFEPTLYFIDTTFAAPLLECSDPRHPLTLIDDMYWKRKLSEYAREMFGLFGSEEGQEWAVPCADYFEGLMSHKTHSNESEIIIPLFEMVYGDCINLYTHQGDRATPGRPTYILDHILYAEMPIYDFGSHLYFKSGIPTVGIAKPFVHELKQIGPRKFEITYAWEVKATAKRDYNCFVHFCNFETGQAEGIAFQNDHKLPVRPTSWKPGETVIDGPYLVEIPEGKEGSFDILIGLWDETGRVPLVGNESGNLRYTIGQVNLSSGKITFERSPKARINTHCFSQQSGWAAHLNAVDRFIKNTYEVLSPLNRITAHMPMTKHEFLTPDRKVEKSQFGNVTITVNYGSEPFRTGNTVLPQYGFLVESPTFVAFHAEEYGGLKFSATTMITAASLDGKPIARSSRIRLYRAFGDEKVRIAGRDFEVETEAIY